MTTGALLPTGLLITRSLLILAVPNLAETGVSKPYLQHLWVSTHSIWLLLAQLGSSMMPVSPFCIVWALPSPTATSVASLQTF